MASTLVRLNGSTAVGFPGSRKPHLWKKTERDRLEKYPGKCHSSFFLEGYKDMYIYTYIHTVNICAYTYHIHTHTWTYIYINRFCKTLFHSTARSGLSKTKVRMVEATILKTFLPGLPWTSLPRQEKVQASKPCWYPSNSFCHARKEKEPQVLVPIFKGPPALPLHKNHASPMSCPSFHPLRAVCGRGLKPILRGKRGICIIFTPVVVGTKILQNPFSQHSKIRFVKIKS